MPAPGKGCSIQGCGSKPRSCEGLGSVGGGTGPSPMALNTDQLGLAGWRRRDGGTERGLDGLSWLGGRPAAVLQRRRV